METPRIQKLSNFHPDYMTKNFNIRTLSEIKASDPVPRCVSNFSQTSSLPPTANFPIQEFPSEILSQLWS
ncbi:hypothetical protein EAI_12608 [Harpegnathos saltator]|uniref:Uncharacterized protein n=1 Tax=Harpegnathos saltator TaxID=610380 RepID=E2B536_HARSA|nr:hypothetical protein EAI_12608 [Harpegnathos saltator]